MEVTEELYRWLRSLNESLPVTKSQCGKVKMGAAALEEVVSGKLAFTATSRHMLMSEDYSGECPESPEGMWQTVFSYLEAIRGQVLSEEVKSAVIGGEEEAAVAVLSDLWECELESATGMRREGAVSLPSLDPRKPLAQSRTCLEFLLLSFCAHFGLTAQQAAGLLTQNNKYLAFLLAKGFKQSFEEVKKWCGDVRTNAHVLINCLKNERDSLLLVLSAFRPGLLSREVEVVKTCSSLLKEVARSASDRPDVLWSWFTGDLGGVDASVLASRRFGKDVIPELSEMLLALGSAHTSELLTHCFRSQLPDFEEYIRLVSELIAQFMSVSGGKEALDSTELLSSLITACLQEAEASPKKSLRLTALNLASSLWSLFPDRTEKDPTIKASILSLFKRGCRDKSLAFSHSCIAQLFHLMDFFYDLRNSNAAVILNLLTAVLLDCFQNGTIREFVLGNFRTTAEKIPSFPIASITDLVIKQWNLSDDPEFDLFDIDFFMEIARCPHLSMENAVTLADILGRVYLSKFHLAKAVAVPFLLLAERFKHEETIAEYLWRFCKLGLCTAMEQEMARIQQKNMLPRYMSQPVRLNPTLSAAVVYEQTTKRHFKHLILELVDRCIRLSVVSLNAKLKTLMVGQAAKFRREKGESHKGWIYVLGTLGNAKEMLAEYEAARSQIVVRTPSIPPPVLAIENKPCSTNAPTSDKSSSLTDRCQLKPRTYSTPHSRNNPKDCRTAPLLKVPSELGFDFSCVEITDEEQKCVSVLLRKYGRMVKQLFKAYIGTGFNRRKERSFSNQVASTTNMSESEFSHLLRDLGVHQGLLSKAQLIAFLNNYSRGSETNGFDYGQFLELLTSVAIAVRAKAEPLKSHQPAVFAVQSLLQCFRNNVKSQFDKRLFDEPRLMPGDAVALRKLNESLALDPCFPLPKNYRRVKEPDVTVSFSVPALLSLSPTHSLVLELLDSVIHAKFSVHFLEPIVSIGETVFAMEEIRADQDLLTRKPTFCRMSEGIRIQALELARNFDYGATEECGFLVDDLIYAVENGLGTVVEQHRPGIATEKKRKMKEVAERLRKNEANLAEMRRKKQREMMLEVSVSIAERRAEEKKEELRQKREEENARAAAEAKAEKERQRRLEENAKALAAWKAQKEEATAKLQEEMHKHKEKLEQEKAQRRLFLKQQREQISRLIESKRSERLSVAQEQEKLSQQLADGKLAKKQQVADMLEQERLLRAREAQTKAEFEQLWSREEVQTELRQFTASLEVVFRYYVRKWAKSPTECEEMNLAGLTRMCQEMRVVPDVCSKEIMVQIYRMLTKGKSGSLTLNFSEFLQTLVRIASVSQGKLSLLQEEEAKSLAISACPPHVIRQLFDHMTIPADPKKMIDLLKAV